MVVSFDLLVNAIVAGILLGGFYAAVTVGITISFGMLDIANIAQPAFILLGSYAAYIFNSYWGIDPILVGFVMTPVFYVIGMVVYQLYYHAFESRGEQSIQGLAFFFGLLFVAEVARGEFIWPTGLGLLLLVYVALGPAFLAQVLYMRGVQLIGPGRAGVFVNLVPLFGALMAIGLLGEPFAAYHLLALALVVGGIAIAQRAPAASGPRR